MNTNLNVPISYVEYLEEQQQLLVSALRRCWSRLEPSSEEPSVHTILENMGVLTDFPLRRQRESGFAFEEDLETLRERCEAEAGAVSSASATTSQVASAEPTPARLTPEAESGPSFPFQPSRQQTWSPQSRPFQRLPPQTVARQRQSPPTISNAPPMFMSGTSSAPSSIYESSADVFQNPQWQPNALSHVHSEPIIVSTPGSYWHTPQWQPEEHRGSWPSEANVGDPQYSTVDPNDVMLATTTGPYFESQEDWDEFFRHMQERQQR